MGANFFGCIKPFHVSFFVGGQVSCNDKLFIGAHHPFTGKSVHIGASALTGQHPLHIALGCPRGPRNERVVRIGRFSFRYLVFGHGESLPSGQEERRIAGSLLVVVRGGYQIANVLVSPINRPQISGQLHKVRAANPISRYRVAKRKRPRADVQTRFPENRGSRSYHLLTHLLGGLISQLRRKRVESRLVHRKPGNTVIFRRRTGNETTCDGNHRKQRKSTTHRS